MKKEWMKKLKGGGTSMVVPEGDDTELKEELSRAVQKVLDDHLHCQETDFDHVVEAVLDLKEFVFKKKDLSIQVPEQFKCPISKQIMVDPVIVSTGETYDRMSIQAQLDARCQTCPKTKQVLSSTNLIPNNVVREMILQFCQNKRIKLPESANLVDIMPIGDEKHFHLLVSRMASESVSDQKKAAKEIRTLTKQMVAFRTFFCEDPAAIRKILAPLLNGKPNSDPEFQEDLITTVYNLSIQDRYKKVIAETPDVIPLLIESLRFGTIHTRSNAAAALFALSTLDTNKDVIGKAGAIIPLIDLLQEGHQIAIKDASQSIWRLCLNHENKGRAVNAGAVKVLWDKMVKGVLADELLSILAALSCYHRAVEEMSALGAVPYLMNMIKGEAGNHSKENCITILHSICSIDRTKLNEVREEEKANGTITLLSLEGSPRAQRKAYAILDRLNKFLFTTHTA